MFLHPFPHAFGLDINDLSIKVVQVQHAPHRGQFHTYHLVTARSIRLPHGLIVGGELQQPEVVRKYIQHLLIGNHGSQRAIVSPWAVVSLPDSHGFIKLITIEKNAEDLIDEDIVFHAKKHVPFEDDAYYIDWQIMPYEQTTDGVSHVLIGAIPKAIADMYTYLLESLGLGVVALEIESLAIARALITKQKSYEGEARALLELGATRSSLIIFDHGHIQLNRSLQFSGELITTAIAQQLHLPYEEAEKEKIHHGLSVDQGMRWPMVVKLVDSLAEDIQKTITFYYTHFPSPNKVTHLTMCGGGAALSRLDRILGLKLKVKAAPGNVWKNLNTRRPIPLPAQDSLGYATAIGLALRAARNPFTSHH